MWKIAILKYYFSWIIRRGGGTKKQKFTLTAVTKRSTLIGFDLRHIYGISEASLDLCLRNYIYLKDSISWFTFNFWYTATKLIYLVAISFGRLLFDLIGEWVKTLCNVFCTVYYLCFIRDKSHLEYCLQYSNKYRIGRFIESVICHRRKNRTYFSIYL